MAWWPSTALCLGSKGLCNDAWLTLTCCRHISLPAPLLVNKTFCLSRAQHPVLSSRWDLSLSSCSNTTPRYRCYIGTWHYPRTPFSSIFNRNMNPSIFICRYVPVCHLQSHGASEDAHANTRPRRACRRQPALQRAFRLFDEDAQGWRTTWGVSWLGIDSLAWGAVVWSLLLGVRVYLPPVRPGRRVAAEYARATVLWRCRWTSVVAVDVPRRRRQVAHTKRHTQPIQRCYGLHTQVLCERRLVVFLAWYWSDTDPCISHEWRDLRHSDVGVATCWKILAQRWWSDRLDESVIGFREAQVPASLPCAWTRGRVILISSVIEWKAAHVLYVSVLTCVDAGFTSNRGIFRWPLTDHTTLNIPLHKFCHFA